MPEGEVVECFHNISLLTLDVMLQCTCSFESNCQEVGWVGVYVVALSVFYNFLVYILKFCNLSV